MNPILKVAVTVNAINRLKRPYFGSVTKIVVPPKLA
jgi:hypothetical protein